MKITIIRLLSITMLLTCGTFARAEDGLPDPKELFEDLDQNSDGKLVADEIPADQHRFFERLLRIADKNEDGQLTEEEFLKAHEADEGPGLSLSGLGGVGDKQKKGGNFKERFEKLDRNSDGKVTKDELPEPFKDRLLPIFERLGKEELTMDDFRKVEAVMAQGKRPNGEKLFQQLDTNGDGKFTSADAPKKKAKQLVDEYLKQAGLASDAEVTKEDFLAFVSEKQGNRERGPRRPDGPPDGEKGPPPPPHHKPKFFGLLDADDDGVLSQEEWAKAGDLFAKLDTNNDGELDFPEVMGPPPEGFGPPGERMREGGNRKGPPEGGSPGPQMFQRFDENGDGKLSEDEVPPRMKERFSKLDQDGDGYLTPDELKNAMQGRMGGKPGKKKPGSENDSENKERPKRPPSE